MQKQKLFSSIMLVLIGGIPAVSNATAPEGFQPAKNAALQTAAADVDVSGVRWNFFDDQVNGELSTVIKTRFAYNNFIRGHAISAAATTQADFDITQGGVIASGTVLDRKFSYYLAGDFVYDGKNSDGITDAHVDLNTTAKMIPTKLASLEDAYITYRSCQWAYAQEDADILKNLSAPLELGLHFPE